MNGAVVQVAQLALLAQAGAWVPATSMELSVLDAIHTRMGAFDNILQGRSTFLEELLDTSQLLGRATAHSLVLLDELGRGTATHDGVAIAAAVLQHLTETTRCCCLFVTHYPEVRLPPGSRMLFVDRGSCLFACSSSAAARSHTTASRSLWWCCPVGTHSPEVRLPCAACAGPTVAVAC